MCCFESTEVMFFFSFVRLTDCVSMLVENITIGSQWLIFKKKAVMLVFFLPFCEESILHPQLQIQILYMPSHLNLKHRGKSGIYYNTRICSSDSHLSNFPWRRKIVAQAELSDSCPDFQENFLACPDFPNQTLACFDFRD